MRPPGRADPGEGCGTQRGVVARRSWWIPHAGPACGPGGMSGPEPPSRRTADRRAHDAAPAPARLAPADRRHRDRGRVGGARLVSGSAPTRARRSAPSRSPAAGSPDEPIGTVTAEGACDTRACHAATAGRGADAVIARAPRERRARRGARRPAPRPRDPARIGRPPPTSPLEARMRRFERLGERVHVTRPRPARRGASEPPPRTASPRPARRSRSAPGGSAAGRDDVLPHPASRDEVAQGSRWRSRGRSDGLQGPSPLREELSEAAASRWRETSVERGVYPWMHRTPASPLPASSPSSSRCAEQGRCGAGTGPGIDPPRSALVILG